MMGYLADWIVRRRVAWSVVIFTLVVSAVAGVFASRVEQDDDVLAFLPRSDPDVAAFYDINRRFGGLDVALVGIEGDVLEPAYFESLQALTRTLNDSPAIDFALSIANVDDFVVAREGGIETDLLIRSIPTEPAAREALAKKIRSRDLVVGQLVSPSLDAVLVLVFPTAGGDPRSFADQVYAITRNTIGERTVHFGGAPFVSSYVYEATQADLSRLLPWAVAAIILLVLIGFRDLTGALVVLFSAGTGIVCSMALMFVLDVPHNIVLSSMPVIAFSVGSAYGLHVLARYQRLALDRPGPQALSDAVRSVGPTIVAAGLTTVCGLFSFLAMDIEPMRNFGLFTGLGVLASLVFALTFVPASIVVLGHRRVQRDPEGSVLLTALVSKVQFHRTAFGALVALVVIVGAVFAARVDTRMDLSAFFADDSPPARADRFMLDHFGGSQFVQVHVAGDFTDPKALWQLLHLADRIEAIEDVTSVQHIGQVIAQLDEAMEGIRRIPDSADQVKLLYRLLDGRAAVAQLVLDDRREVVLHAKIAKSDVDTVERVLAEVEARVESDGAATWQQIVASRIEVVSRRGKSRVDGAALLDEMVANAPRVDPEAVVRALFEQLRSDEGLVSLDEPTARAVAAAVVTSSASARVVSVLSAIEGQTIDGALADRTLAEDLVASLDAPRVETERRLLALARADRIANRVGTAREDPHWRSHVAAAATLIKSDLKPDEPLAARVSGLPVLHRGLSRSTVRNQLFSLLLALSSVWFVLSLAFRSPRIGFLAAIPTIVTLVIVYGGMGAMGVHLDIGTAMLASLIIGAGVDYAVHFVAAWRDALRVGGGLEDAVSATSTSIWTNALMVAAGFFILTLGEAKPLQNVGGLTAAAMLTAAIATFVCVPLVGKKVLGRS